MTITKEQADQVVVFLKTELGKNKRRAVPAQEIFEKLFPSRSDLQNFRKELATLSKEGNLGPYEPLLGRSGGYGIPKNKAAIPSKAELIEEPEEPELELDEEVSPQDVASPVEKIIASPQVEVKPVEKPVVAPAYQAMRLPTPKITYQPIPMEAKELVVGGTTYKVPETFTKMLNVLVNVFEAKEDESGDIIFEGKKYKCADDRVKQYLDNFVFFCLGAAQKIEKKANES